MNLFKLLGRYLAILLLSILIAYSNQVSAKEILMPNVHPQDAREHNNLGVYLGAKGHYLASLRELEIAVNLDPTNIVYTKNLSATCLRYGDVLRVQHKLPEAIEQFRAALFADFDNGVAQHYLDSCLKLSGCAPNTLETRLNTAKKFEKDGNYKMAAVEYFECVRRQDSAEFNYAVGRCLYKAKGPQHAAKYLKKALELPWPENESKDKSECQSLLKVVE